ncbi:hypothetical protein Q8F55_003754 [Vanrija albida]|uniref:Uncharacterized protein n=1 Tax=Vanrija albida TaxID=181172 RepID=A0ABR3Q5E7_9TREE
MRALIRLSSTPTPHILQLPGFDPKKSPPERDSFLPESPSSPVAEPSPGPASPAELAHNDDKAQGVPSAPEPPTPAPDAPVTCHYVEKQGDAPTMPATAPALPPNKSIIPAYINLSQEPIPKPEANETPRRAPAAETNEFDDIVELSESDFTPEEILRSENKRKRRAVARQSHTPAPSSAPTGASVDLSHIDSSPIALRKSPRIARSNVSSSSTPSRQAIDALKDHLLSPSKPASSSKQASSSKAAPGGTRRRVAVSSDSEPDDVPPPALVESSDDEVLRRPKRSRTKSPAKEASTAASSSSKSPSPPKSSVAAKSSRSSSPALSSTTAKPSPVADTPSPAKSNGKGKGRAVPSPKRAEASLANLFDDDEDEDEEEDEFAYLDGDLDYAAIPFPLDGIAIPDFSQYPPVRGASPSPPVYEVPDDDDDDDDFLPVMTSHPGTRARGVASTVRAATPAKAPSPIKFTDLKFISDLDERLQFFYRNHWRHKGAAEEDEEESDDDEEFRGVAAPVSEGKFRGSAKRGGGGGGRAPARGGRGGFRPWGKKRGGRR